MEEFPPNHLTLLFSQRNAWRGGGGGGQRPQEGDPVFPLPSNLNPYKTCSQHQCVNALIPMAWLGNTSCNKIYLEIYRTACGTPLFLETLQLNLSISDRGTPITVNLGPILLIEKYVQYNLWQDHFIRKTSDRLISGYLN